MGKGIKCGIAAKKPCTCLLYTSNLGGVVPYVIVRTNQKEVDALLGNIGETAPSSPKSGDFWYKVDHTAQSVVLMKYDGAEWKNATEKQALTYTWYMHCLLYTSGWNNWRVHRFFFYKNTGIIYFMAEWGSNTEAGH